MTTCKSPTHKAYVQAVEGLYIQTWIAKLELDKIMAEAGTGSDAREKGRFLLNKESQIDEVIERLRFGRSEVNAATVAVDRHFDRGCRAVEVVP